MIENAAAEMMDSLLADLEMAPDAERFRRIYEQRITSTETHDGRAPGFPNDLPDGIYFNGFHFMSKIDGRTWFLDREQFAASPAIARLWTEMHQARREEARFAREVERQQAEVGRRGRPEIGRPVEVRIPEWRLAAIDAYAERNDLTRAETIRRMIEAGAAALEEREGDGRPTA